MALLCILLNAFRSTKKLYSNKRFYAVHHGIKLVHGSDHMITTEKGTFNAGSHSLLMRQRAQSSTPTPDDAAETWKKASQQAFQRASTARLSSYSSGLGDSSSSNPTNNDGTSNASRPASARQHVPEHVFPNAHAGNSAAEQPRFLQNPLGPDVYVSTGFFVILVYYSVARTRSKGKEERASKTLLCLFDKDIK